MVPCKLEPKPQCLDGSKYTRNLTFIFRWFEIYQKLISMLKLVPCILEPNPLCLDGSKYTEPKSCDVLMVPRILEPIPLCLDGSKYTRT